MVKIFQFFCLMRLHVYTKTVGTKMLCGLSNNDKRRINKTINEQTAENHFLLF